MKSFDLFNPESSIFGHHFLEASAGTGKTFAIEQLTARFIAEEGVMLDEILIVTFTRAAVRELKTRIEKTLQKREFLSPSIEEISLRSTDFVTACSPNMPLKMEGDLDF